MTTATAGRNNEQALGGVMRLASSIADAVQGFEKMVEEAEADLKPVVAKLHAQHSADASELTNAVVGLGGDPERIGSLMGTVHSTVATVRAAVGKLDKSALDAILDGEQNLIEAYDEAAAETVDVPEINRLVTAQRSALQNLLATLRT